MKYCIDPVTTQIRMTYTITKQPPTRFWNAQIYALQYIVLHFSFFKNNLSEAFNPLSAAEKVLL